MGTQEFKKYSNIRVNYKVSITSETGYELIGDSDWELLLKIQENASLKIAAEKVGISYRKAWGDLRKIENKLGFAIVEKNRGGESGGYTKLTAEGETLINAYKELNINFQNAVNKYIIEFKKSIKS